MKKYQKISLVLFRVLMGWMFFYAGITKVLNPKWSAAGYLKGAHTFVGFYHWLASPKLLPFVNFANEWGLTLLGVSLILGIFIRYSAPLGAVLMFLYYFVILQFPHPNVNSFLVDEHVLYSAGLFVLAAFRADTVWSLAEKYPKLK